MTCFFTQFSHIFNTYSGKFVWGVIKYNRIFIFSGVNSSLVTSGIKTVTAADLVMQVAGASTAFLSIIDFVCLLLAYNMNRNGVFTVYLKKYAHGFCFAVLCCGYTLTDFPISIRLTSLALWQSNDCPSASKQPWWIWINTSCEFIMNDCITTTKQSTTKPCAYFLGYTVRPGRYRSVPGMRHRKVSSLCVPHVTHWWVTVGPPSCDDRPRIEPAMGRKLSADIMEI